MGDEIILLGHGSGGRMTQRLIEKIIIPAIGGEAKTGSGLELDDAAPITLPEGKPFFTTDSYIVDPFIFPGGNIGELAVNGTINDLGMRGAKPVAISVGLILEEGLPIKDLKTVIHSMGVAARRADVKIVCGDTKVTPRGFCDKIFINTSGVGVAPKEAAGVGAASAQPGDVIIVSGTVGDHGAAIMLARENLPFSAPLKSDTASLNRIVENLLTEGVIIHTMRDPTRGGLATTMVEIAESSRCAIVLDERKIPVAGPVAAACELLGLDPLMVANEGKMIAIIPKSEEEKALKIIRSHQEGREAAVIGEVKDGPKGKVTLISSVGGERMVTRLEGELLPRIC